MLRAPRAARAAANDRLQGGSGAVPRRESGPLDFRVRQAAFDVMTRVRGSAADRELHLDWALGATNVPAILKAIADFEGTAAGDAILLTAAARQQAADDAVAKKSSATKTPSVKFFAPGVVDAPITCGNETHMLSEISTMEKVRRHRLACKWASTKYQTDKKASSRAVAAEAATIFGADAAPAYNSITKMVNRGKTGMSPSSVGRPRIVPPSVTQMIVQFAGAIRAIKVPVYLGTNTQWWAICRH